MSYRSGIACIDLVQTEHKVSIQSQAGSPWQTSQMQAPSVSSCQPNDCGCQHSILCNAYRAYTRGLIPSAGTQGILVAKVLLFIDGFLSLELHLLFAAHDCRLKQGKTSG